MKEIKLTRGKFAMVDDDDYERVNKLKWSLEDSGKNGHELYYAKRLHPVIRGKKYVRLTMHKFIMGDIPEGMVIDHINLNGLDNRKENLRPCNTSENNSNRICMPKSTSKYLGVYFHKGTGKYMARIKKDKSTIYLGVFKDEKDAAIAYNKAAIKYHNQFANLNKI